MTDLLPGAGKEPQPRADKAEAEAEEEPSSGGADRRPRAGGPGLRDGLRAVTLGRENGSENIKEERDCHGHGLQRTPSPA